MIFHFQTRLIIILLFLSTFSVRSQQIEPSTFSILEKLYPDFVKSKMNELVHSDKDSLERDIIHAFLIENYRSLKLYADYYIRLGIQSSEDISKDIPLILSLIDYPIQNQPHYRHFVFSKWNGSLSSTIPYSICEPMYLLPLMIITRQSTFTWINDHKTEILNRVKNAPWHNSVDSLSILSMLPSYNISIDDTISYYNDLPHWIKGRIGSVTSIDSLINQYNNAETLNEKRIALHALINTQDERAIESVIWGLSERGLKKYLKCYCIRPNAVTRKATFFEYSLEGLYKTYSSNEEFQKLYTSEKKSIAERELLISMYQEFINRHILKDFTFKKRYVERYIEKHL